jgi:hypothetical protein
MGTRVHGWAGRAAALVTTSLAMIVMMTPLAMWVSWTDRIFIGVSAVGVVAAVLYCLLDRGEAPASRDRPAAPQTVSDLDDRLLAELSNLQPFVYHNRLSADSRLRRTLDKVKAALERMP